MKNSYSKEKQGRATWAFAHMFSEVADQHPRDNDEVVLSTVLLSMRCEICNDETREYIAQNPIQRPLAQWTNRFHDHVNARLGKKKKTCATPSPMLVLAVGCGLSVAVGYYVGKNSRTCEVRYET